jgi:hypothetical protein
MPTIIRRHQGGTLQHAFNDATNQQQHSSSLSTSKTECESRRVAPERLIRTTILGALGVLAAFTVRDLMMAMFQTLMTPQKSLLAMSAYTAIVFIVVIVVTIAWS